MRVLANGSALAAAAAAMLIAACGGRQQAAETAGPEPSERGGGEGEQARRPAEERVNVASDVELCPVWSRASADLLPVRGDGPVGSVHLVDLGGDVRVNLVALGLPRGSYQLELADLAYCPVAGESPTLAEGSGRRNSQRPGDDASPAEARSLGTISAGPDGWVEREWIVPGLSFAGGEQVEGRGILLRQSGVPEREGAVACGIVTPPTELEGGSETAMTSGR